MMDLLKNRFVGNKKGVYFIRISTERLIIRELCELDYPQFERTLNEAQKNYFGSGEGFLSWLISQYATMDIINGLISFGMFNKRTQKLLGTWGCRENMTIYMNQKYSIICCLNIGDMDLPQRR